MKQKRGFDRNSDGINGSQRHIHVPPAHSCSLYGMADLEYEKSFGKELSGQMQELR